MKMLPALLLTTSLLGQPFQRAIAPIRSTTQSITTLSSNGIEYHGGPVMLGVPNIYVIWYGDWTPASPAVPIVSDFLQNISGTPWQLINATYFDSSGVHISGQTAYIASVYDHYSKGSSLTDASIQAIVASHVGVDIPLDTNAVYFVLTSGDVDETEPFGQFGVNYCGWHNASTINGGNLKYSFVGDSNLRFKAACQSGYPAPNGTSGGDALVNIIAHELVESTSDPNLNAWFDSAGAENADKCAWRFWKTYQTANGGYANMHIGGRDYMIQMNWVNALGGYCGLWDNSAHPPTAVIKSPAPNQTFTCVANTIQVPVSGVVTDWTADQSSGLVRLTVAWPNDIGGTQFSQGWFNSGDTWTVPAPCKNGTVSVEGFDASGAPALKVTNNYYVDTVTQPPPSTNTAPTIFIISPANGSVFSCGSIRFTASASDQEQGDISAQIKWSNGAVGASVSISFGCGGPNLGNKSIIAKITDAGGLQASAAVNITIKKK